VRYCQLVAALFLSLAARAQTMPAPESRYYAPRDSAAVSLEYSNSSSHIILGDDRQRKFAGLALAYERGITANHWMAWSYSAEIRPLQVESDPTLTRLRIVITSEGKTQVIDGRFLPQLPITNINDELYRNQIFSGTLPDGAPATVQVDNYLGRRWTYAPGVSPVGFSMHLLPERPVQAFLASTAGFIVSPRDIPEFQTSAFNFSFSFGGGVEWFRDRRRSWMIEYRVQHMSNKKIGTFNPGVDSQFVRVGYRFGF
jgi:hypothetical protein